MILKHDIQNYQITFMDITTGEQVCYEYTDGTEFFDKYGNYTLREDFSEGKLAVIEAYCMDGELRQAGENAALAALDYRLIHACMRRRWIRGVYLLSVLRSWVVRLM